MTKAFVLYDGRAIVDIEDAAIMDTASSEKEAKKTGIEDWAGYDYVWVEYDLIEKKLYYEALRPDLPPFSITYGNNN